MNFNMVNNFVIFSPLLAMITYLWNTVAMDATWDILTFLEPMLDVLHWGVMGNGMDLYPLTYLARKDFLKWALPPRTTLLMSFFHRSTNILQEFKVNYVVPGLELTAQSLWSTGFYPLLWSHLYFVDLDLYDLPKVIPFQWHLNWPQWDYRPRGAVMEDPYPEQESVVALSPTRPLDRGNPWSWLPLVVVDLVHVSGEAQKSYKLVPEGYTVENFLEAFGPGHAVLHCKLVVGKSQNEFVYRTASKLQYQEPR
jgi:hypothetical protein